MTALTKPDLALDVEIESPDGEFRLAADASKAGNRPRGLSFSTQRGDGFGTGGCSISRQIFRDYPDLELLNTVRFIGHNGDIAYEGRLHSNPRTNDPVEQIDLALVGWMTYLKTRKIAPLIIDRRVEGWQDPSTQRKADLYASGFRSEGSLAEGWQGTEGKKAPGLIFDFHRFDGTFKEIGEAWLYAGGEDIGELRYDFDTLASGADINWTDKAHLCSDDTAASFDPGANHGQSDAENQAVVATESGRKYAMLQSFYEGPTTGDANEGHAWLNPRLIGTHGLTERGESPGEGYYLTDIIEYLLATYAPKVTWAGLQNTFALTQAAWQDSPQYLYDILQQLNNLVLWETNMWEERTLSFEPADLTTYDWQIRTDEAGVSCVFQGDSIENFSNGVTVTYTDSLTGKQKVLYPSEHAELRDESESNPFTRQGEEGWTDAEMPWQGTEAEALQFGRAYLVEWNRPKRPGTYRVQGGYIKDGAGHWHQGWKPRSSETVGILDHPEDAPRLITQTDWDDEGHTLTLTVDAPSKFLDAVIARMEIARTAKGLS